MKKVMCFGTFDILHPGHEFYLIESKKLGDYLVVVVALDETVVETKGKVPRNNQQKRLSNLEKLNIADKVVLGNASDRLKVVVDEKPDIVCFGYDQNVPDELLERIKTLGIMTKRMPSYMPHKYKSSLL